MEPAAYEHFTRTGEFRDGTMLALLLHGVGENVQAQRRGRFAAEIHGVEMAVKDSRHHRATRRQEDPRAPQENRERPGPSAATPRVRARSSRLLSHASLAIYLPASSLSVCPVDAPKHLTMRLDNPCDTLSFSSRMTSTYRLVHAMDAKTWRPGKDHRRQVRFTDDAGQTQGIRRFATSRETISLCGWQLSEFRGS